MSLKPTVLVFALMLVPVGGCALHPPKCTDPTYKAVLQGVFTFGIFALWRAEKCRGPESDDELLARGEGLIEEGDVVELYRIGIIFFYYLVHIDEPLSHRYLNIIVHLGKGSNLDS